MQPYIAHPCCNQLTAVTTGYLLTSITWPYRGLSIDPSRSSIFMKLSADKLPVFKWQFFKCIECVYEPHKRAALFTILFQTDLGRENAASYYRQGMTFIAMVTRWSRSMSNFNALIGQNLIKGEWCGKFMQHLETCLPIAEADTISCPHLLMFLTVFFSSGCKKRNTVVIKISL